MQVVRGPSGRKQDNVLGVGDSGDVTTESVGMFDEVGAVLSAEYAMHQVGSVGVRHAGRVTGNGGCYRDRWHIGMCRPYGTRTPN